MLVTTNVTAVQPTTFRKLMKLPMRQNYPSQSVISVRFGTDGCLCWQGKRARRWRGHADHRAVEIDINQMERPGLIQRINQNVSRSCAVVICG